MNIFCRLSFVNKEVQWGYAEIFPNYTNIGLFHFALKFHLPRPLAVFSVSIFVFPPVSVFITFVSVTMPVFISLPFFISVSAVQILLSMSVFLPVSVFLSLSVSIRIFFLLAVIQFIHIHLHLYLASHFWFKLILSKINNLELSTTTTRFQNVQFQYGRSFPDFFAHLQSGRKVFWD